MDVMRVEVVSNEYNIYSGEASFVVVPTVQGELGIYPRHEPIMSLVRPGALRLKIPGEKEEVLVAVSGGVLRWLLLLQNSKPSTIFAQENINNLYFRLDKKHGLPCFYSIL